MQWPTSQATDDRGARVKLVKLTPALYQDDPELGVTLGRVHESIWNSGGILSMRVALPVLIGALMGIGGLTMVTMLGNIMPWVMPVCVGLAMALGLRLFMDFARRKHAQRIVESVLRIGRCPGCGYDLRSAATEPDGVRLCAECGACWKHERVGNAPVSQLDRPVPPDAHGDTRSVSALLSRMILRTPTIVDDRNRSVARVGINLPGLEEQIGPQCAADARREVLRSTAVRRYGCALPVALLGLLIVLSACVGIFKAGAGWVSAASILTVLWMLLIYSTICWRIIAGRMPGSSQPVVRILLRRSICPSCAATLAGQSPEGDGCVLCPRCAAAWKLDANPVADVAGRAQSSARSATTV